MRSQVGEEGWPEMEAWLSGDTAAAAATRAQRIEQQLAGLE